MDTDPKFDRMLRQPIDARERRLSIINRTLANLPEQCIQRTTLEEERRGILDDIRAHDERMAHFARIKTRG